MTTKVAVVTGSSSGIGFETALLLARNGFHTYATMRNLDKSQSIMDVATKEELPLQAIQLDVNDEKSVTGAIDSIIAEKQSIDVLVNNAGYALAGSVEDLSMEEVKAQFETNLFGVIRVTQAVLPYMRKQKQGTVVNLSSIVGRVAFPGAPVYDSTKFAVEGLSEAMRYELEPFGIRTVIIEPGLINTNFTKAIVMGKKVLDPNSPYGQFVQKIITNLDSLYKKEGMPPVEVAKVILKAVTAENPETRYLVGEDAIKLVDAKKKMPDSDFEALAKQTFLAVESESGK